MTAAAGGDPHAARIGRLRAAMRARDVAACVVPSADPHLSEYLPERWQARRWLCGFDGSAGTLVVAADAAGLWVDDRYIELARQQLEGSGVTPMPLPPSRAPVWIDWLCAAVAPGGCIAVDGDVLSPDAAARLEAPLRRHGLRLRTDLDLPGAVWSARPALPTAPVRALPAGLQGHDRRERLARLRAEMAAAGAGWHLVSALDEIAWLLGLRGADVPYNPVFLAHLLLGPERGLLCVDASRFEAGIVAALAGDGIDVAPYAAAAEALAAIAPGQCLLVDPARTTVGLLASLQDGVRQLRAANPCQLLKAVKSDAEIARIRDTMAQDGAALCAFFAWLEQALADGGTTEIEIDARMGEARARRPASAGPSFATIAGFNANGAMPHYRATPERHAAVAGDGLLLIDSGGQYTGGTTDITRMAPVGALSAAQRRDCTLVLKGLIALSSARFPAGTRAPMLDAIARAPLWRAGLDYGHGTGHGVGFFLNVHEGPQSISFRADAQAGSEMLAGMVTSIEPGIYRPGQWGVRWENLVHARPCAAHPGFLEFETLTLCPIDTRCLDAALLAPDEIEWLDRYHAGVRARLLPLVEAEAVDWLQRRTQPLR